MNIPFKTYIASELFNKAICEKADGKLYYWEGNDESSSVELNADEMSQVNAKYAELEAAYNSSEYHRNRATSYPSIADQLDMLYHDIKNGTLDSGNWIAAIEAVKTQYPKP